MDNAVPRKDFTPPAAAGDDSQPQPGRRPWTAPKVTPARIDEATNKTFSTFEIGSPFIGPS